MIPNYPIWTASTPNTCADASPNSFRAVTDATILRVQNAFYRGAFFSGDIEVVHLKSPIKLIGTKVPKYKCQAGFSWFSVKPPKTLPQVDLTKPGCTYTLIQNFSGDVIDNLGK